MKSFSQTKRETRMLRLSLIVLLGSLAAVLLSACGAGVPASQAGSLVIYSGRSESLVAPIIEDFAAATGIDVQVRYGSSSEIAATLLEEGGNSPADLFFAQDSGALGAVADAGLLAELPEEVLSLVDSSFASPEKLWVGISGRARVVVYNTERLSPEDLPADMWGFTEPEWKGRIGLPPSNGSFQTMVTGMRQIWGEADTRSWLEGIMANEPIFYEKNTPMVAAVAAGEVDIGFVNHYYLHRFIAEEGEAFTARNYFLPAGGPGSLIMLAGAGRLASGENKANAIAFLNFLLSQEAQKYFAEQTFEYPLIAGVQLASELIPLSELNVPSISPGQLSDIRGTVMLLQEVGMLP